MELLRFVNEYWTVLAGFTGAVIWFTRLEGKISSHDQFIARLEKDLDTLTVKHENLDSKLVQQLADVRESLARIEGALGVKE